jgi:hypothetical protein
MSSFDFVDAWYHVCSHLATRCGWGLLHVCRASRAGFLLHRDNKRDYDEWIERLCSVSRLTSCPPRLLTLHRHVAVDLLCSFYWRTLPGASLRFPFAYIVHGVDEQVLTRTMMRRTDPACPLYETFKQHYETPSTVTRQYDLLMIDKNAADLEHTLALLTGFYARRSSIKTPKILLYIIHFFLREHGVLIVQSDIKRNCQRNGFIVSVDCSTVYPTITYVENQHIYDYRIILEISGTQMLKGDVPREIREAGTEEQWQSRIEWLTKFL